VRQQLAARHADLSKRLVTKHQERDRYIRLCARGYITEGELDTYLADLRTRRESRALVGGRRGYSEEAFRARRQMVRLLVEGIVIEDKRKEDELRVRITYRFEELDESGELCEVFRNTKRFFERFFENLKEIHPSGSPPPDPPSR
jgi:hypothetical protein